MDRRLVAEGLRKGLETAGGSRSEAAEDLVHVLVVGRHDPLVLLLEDRGGHGPHLAMVRRALEEDVADLEGGGALLGLEDAVFVEDAGHDGRLGLLGDDRVHGLTALDPVVDEPPRARVARVGVALDLVEGAELVVGIGIGSRIVDLEHAVPVSLARLDVDRRAPGGHGDGNRDLAGDELRPRLRECPAGGPGLELGEVVAAEHEFSFASNPEGFHRPKVRHGRL